MSSTAEAVLQEMDNISSIRQNREVERLRMWTGDTEEVSPFILHCINQLKNRRVQGNCSMAWCEYEWLLFSFLGKHGYVLQSEAEEVLAQEQLQLAHAPQSDEQK